MRFNDKRSTLEILALRLSFSQFLKNLEDKLSWIMSFCQKSYISSTNLVLIDFLIHCITTNTLNMRLSELELIKSKHKRIKIM